MKFTEIRKRKKRFKKRHKSQRIATTELLNAGTSVVALISGIAGAIVGFWTLADSITFEVFEKFGNRLAEVTKVIFAGAGTIIATLLILRVLVVELSAITIRFGKTIEEERDKVIPVDK